MPGKKGSRTRNTPRHGASYPEVLHASLVEVLRAPPEQFYIKRPPSDLLVTDFPEKVPNLYAPVMEREYFGLAARLRKIQKEYRRTGNGMHLLGAFLMTHELGLYPPQVRDAPYVWTLYSPYRHRYDDAESSDPGNWLQT